MGASGLYEHALNCPSMAPLHTQMIDFVAEEGGNRGIALLETLRDSCQDPERRRQIQRRLIRLGTAAIDLNVKQKKPLQGEIYLGSCDGQGAYVIVGFLKRRLAIHPGSESP